MIRFRLAELIADAQFKTGRRIKLMDIAEATGINRMTLSRMTNVRGYSTSTDTIDKLCKYFACDVSDVARYVVDDSVSTPEMTSSALAEAAVAGSADKENLTSVAVATKRTARSKLK
jgi:putative transcriptional regulator